MGTTQEQVTREQTTRVRIYLVLGCVAQTKGSWAGASLEWLEMARVGKITFITWGTHIPTQKAPLRASHTQKQMTSES